MPNKIPLEEVKLKLPQFVTIYDETYVGVRYRAKFKDLDYDEDFEATVRSVVEHQYGCKSRSNAAKRGLNKLPWRTILPLEVVKAKLHSHLEIIEETYRGSRYKAQFRNRETGEVFEAIVHNVLNNKGLGRKGGRLLAIKKISIPLEEIQSRLDALYGGRVSVIPEEYINTQTVVSWLIDGRKVRVAAGAILSGKYLETKNINRWRSYVYVRDNYTCQKCGSSSAISAHHISPYMKDPVNRLNIHNGICLCKFCHTKYHGEFRGEESIETLTTFIPHLKEILTNRFSLPALLPNLEV